MRGTIIQFDASRGLGVIRVGNEELPFDVAAANREFEVGEEGDCEIGVGYSGHRKVKRLTLDELPPEPTFSFLELVETAHNLGLLRAWRLPSEVRAAFGEDDELPDHVPLIDGVTSLLYRYITQDEERARGEGLVLWDARFGNDTQDPFGDLVRLAGGKSDQLLERYDGTVAVLRSPAGEVRVDLSDGLEPMIAHVNAVLTRTYASKKLLLLAFDADAYMIFACPLELLEELRDLGLAIPADS